MAEKKRLRLTAGKRQGMPTPKKPRLVLREGKRYFPVQEQELSDPGTAREGPEIQNRTSRDTVIGTDVESGQSVALPYQRRDLGVAVIGKAGTGKSSLLEHLILSDFAQGIPGMVIDPHGVLAERVVTLAPSAAAHRILLLEPAEAPFGLNLLACREAIDPMDDPVSWAADSVVETIKKLYGAQDEYLPRLEHYLDLAVRTLIPNHGTLAEAPRLFRNVAFRNACLRNVTDQDVREGWALYDSMRTTDVSSQTPA